MVLSPVTDPCLSPSCHAGLVTADRSCGECRAVSTSRPDSYHLAHLSWCVWPHLSSWGILVSFRKPAVPVGRRAVPCARSPVFLSVCMELTQSQSQCTSSSVSLRLSLVLLPHGNSEGGGAVLRPGLSLPPEARALWLCPGLRARWERSHCPGLCDL